MQGLTILLAGIIIAVTVEPIPHWVKTIIWVVLAVIGVVLGGLSFLKV